MRFLKNITAIEWLLILSAVATVASFVVPNSLCFHPDNTKPISSFVDPSDLTDDSPTQLILMSTEQSDGDSAQLTFLLLNNGDSPIYYSGYTPTSFMPRMPSGNVSPLYKKKLNVNNGWHDKEIGWCGNGATRMRLMPGQAGQFSVPQHIDEPVIRIGVYCTADDHSKYRDEDVIWSQEIITH